MPHITRKDLEGAVETYAIDAKLSGLPERELHLQIGSKTYGNAYRLMFVSHGGGLSPAPGTGDGYLGMTARDAYETLWTIIRTMRDVRDWQQD